MPVFLIPPCTSEQPHETLHRVAPRQHVLHKEGSEEAQ